MTVSEAIFKYMKSQSLFLCLTNCLFLFMLLCFFSVNSWTKQNSQSSKKQEQNHKKHKWITSQCNFLDVIEGLVSNIWLHLLPSYSFCRSSMVDLFELYKYHILWGCMVVTWHLPRCCGELRSSTSHIAWCSLELLRWSIFPKPRPDSTVQSCQQIPLLSVLYCYGTSCYTGYFESKPFTNPIYVLHNTTQKRSCSVYPAKFLQYRLFKLFTVVKAKWQMSRFLILSQHIGL